MHFKRTVSLHGSNHLKRGLVPSLFQSASRFKQPKKIKALYFINLG